MTSLFFHSLYFGKIALYVSLFVGTLVEGEISLFSAAFLARHGILNIPLTIFIIILSTTTDSVIWYCLGRKIKDSFSYIARWSNKVALPFDAHLRTRTTHTIFISKFIYGINRAILFRAGAIGIPPKVFLKSDVPATAVWILIVGGAGYFSGASFFVVRHYVKFIEVALLVGIIVFYVLLRFISPYLKKHL